MNRVRNFPPSPSFSAMVVTLATQIADLECSTGSDEETSPLVDAFSTTEKALTRRPIECIGDLLLKIEILSRIAEHSSVDPEEWQALARDVERLNGAGLAFSPEAWLRRWTAKDGGYARTDSGLSFVSPEPPTFQQRLLLDELQRVEGHQAVAAVIDGAIDARPTIRDTWDKLKAAYDAAHRAANAASTACNDAAPDQRQVCIEASDQANHHEYVAWCAVMQASAPDFPAVTWKMIELFGPAGRPDGEPIDRWLRQFTDVIIDDLARLGGNGGDA